MHGKQVRLNKERRVVVSSSPGEKRPTGKFCAGGPLLCRVWVACLWILRGVFELSLRGAKWLGGGGKLELSISC